MIDDLDKTLKNALQEGTGNPEVSFAPPDRNWVKPSKATINVFLYDVRENNQRRQYHWESVVADNQKVNKQQPPLYYDFTYLITCWVADTENEAEHKEHQLLDKCIRILAKNPGLSKTERVGALEELEADDIVTRLGMPEHLPNPIDIWTALSNTPRPMLAYCVTLPISLDPEPEEARPVQTVGFSLQPIDPKQKGLPLSGQATSSKQRNGLPQPDKLPQRSVKKSGHPPESYLIAGMVLDGDGRPLIGAEVSVAGNMTFAVTDENGRYRLGRLHAGSYQLLAHDSEGMVAQKEIRLPPEQQDAQVGHMDWNLQFNSSKEVG